MRSGWSRRRTWLAVYLALLALSHAWRWLRPPDRPVSPTVAVAVVDEGRRTERRVLMAYQRLGSPSNPPVVLLHGSPGNRGELVELANLLADDYFALLPDLPGFGESRARLPDYSTAAHADYVLQWLDALGVERAHAVGFSMGGGVALEIVRRAPARLRSITLLAGIGVQEFELFGDYRLNHAVHAAQLAALWCLHELVPHFGLLDSFPLDVAYARNFLDTDQRPLRGVLEEVEVPLLVIHGESDFLVPVAAAREHHRIVPHSELVVYPSDHFMPFRQPELLAPDLLRFLRRVDRGEARRRVDADAGRLRAAGRPLDPAALPDATGPTLLVWMLLLAVATLVSEDLTCIAAGLLVAQGRLGFVAAAVACSAGIFVGDVMLYLAGRWLGRPWLERAPLKWWLTERRLARSTDWFERRGAAVIFLSRFWPGMRLPTYFAAGVLRTRFLRFVGLFALAVAIWTPLLVGAAAWLGDRMLDRLGTARESLWIVLLAALLLAWLLATARRLATPTGRRRWIAGWRRRLDREFWPPWLFYPPVVAWIVALAARYRHPTLFTAANPAMPAGGFVGESKGDILDALPTEAVARYLRLPAGEEPGERRRTVLDFLDRERLELPVVVKPDVGQRGEAVTIARTERQLDGALTDRRALLVQEHLAGPELGLFYVRHPEEAEGRVFSITRKELPLVHGDGESTLEELILADRRASLLVDVYLEGLERSPDDVPAAGEAVRLVEIGTHCRGAIFRDGADIESAALASWVDGVSRRVDGFYFGRYDLKAPTLADFRAGRRIRILELNGVTSEATHIYDPRYGLLDAYRTLFRQWSLAFEIGAVNRRRGAEPTPLRQLLALALAHLSRGGR